jgi:hypothetical protein
MFPLEIVDMMLQVIVPMMAIDACLQSPRIGYLDDEITARANDGAQYTEDVDGIGNMLQHVIKRHDIKLPELRNERRDLSAIPFDLWIVGLQIVDRDKRFVETSG